MTDKTIKERGLSTITLPAPRPFSFDETTRHLELTFYYQYCVLTHIITVTGEQSRTELIRKTFVHLGATGNTWDAAMRSWLQGKLTSVETDLYKLWQAYFLLYATTGDDEGVTYAGLSMEAAYRRFLSDFIGGGSSGHSPFLLNFNDPLGIADLVKFSQSKAFLDTVTPSDAVNFLHRFIRTFADTMSPSDAVLFRQSKGFLDALALSDAFFVKQGKSFADTVVTSDVLATLLHAARAFADTVLATDAMHIRLGIVKADTVLMTDSLLFRLSKAFADSFTVTDALALKMTFKMDIGDFFDIQETLLFRLNKIISDTVSVSDTVVFSLGGYNQGLYNTGVYNR